MPPLLAALRPHQWTKNLVVFAALGLSKHLFELGPLLQAGLAFLCFCALSGTVYLVNDLVDVERDRLHPEKQQRPIASGAVSVPLARSAALVLGAGSLTVAALLSLEFLACAIAYLALNLLYSFRLKNVVILDVLSISLGFVLRAVAGGVAIVVPISDWLLVCTILLALFLALAKRRAEITGLEAAASGHRAILAEYSPYLLDQMISVVTASCLTAYAFYTLAPETVAKFQTDRLSWTIPFVIYGIFRYLYLVHRKDQGGSPSDVLLTDRPLLLTVFLWAVAVVAIVYTAAGAPAPIGY
ncbi:MAG: decaprenyl-phosphate phosphoribosyltransferase [Vicinamibacteria bacterium]|nr:decaprenyl-phosphate phosphoribosyltransferase [Vicinamibacteria bacterium]